MSCLFVCLFVYWLSVSYWMDVVLNQRRESGFWKQKQQKQQLQKQQTERRGVVIFPAKLQDTITKLGIIVLLLTHVKHHVLITMVSELIMRLLFIMLLLFYFWDHKKQNKTKQNKTFDELLIDFVLIHILTRLTFVTSSPHHQCGYDMFLQVQKQEDPWLNQTINNKRRKGFKKIKQLIMNQ